MDTAVLIVNSVAAFAAVVAAIIAIIVYRKTAKLQVKSINYSLLDDRIKLWKYMEIDRNKPQAWVARALEGRDWELERFKLLFSEDLVKEFEAVCTFKENSTELAAKISSLEREGLPIRIKDGTPNNDDFNRYAAVSHQRKEIQDAGVDSAAIELVAFKELCKKSFQNDKWSEYYQCLLDYLELPTKHKKMLSAFLEHMQDEIRASVS
ncbi:MAG: hypothetical protein IKO68_08800 [Oscillospiraceae bacterium]|nr:hypothetical protein [Oscillospiraceae bacterium]